MISLHAGQSLQWNKTQEKEVAAMCPQTTLQFLFYFDPKEIRSILLWLVNYICYRVVLCLDKHNLVFIWSQVAGAKPFVSGQWWALPESSLPGAYVRHFQTKLLLLVC